MQRMHILSKVSSPMKLVGAHPICLLKKTQSSFEEAHHWNIQAKFYSVRIPTQLDACMMISMEYKDKDEVRVWISQKEILVCPLLSFYFSFSLFSIFCIFWWPQWLFLFNSHLSSLGSFSLSSLGSLLTLGATLYTLQEVQEIFHTL